MQLPALRCVGKGEVDGGWWSGVRGEAGKRQGWEGRGKEGNAVHVHRVVCADDYMMTGSDERDTSFPAPQPDFHCLGGCVASVPCESLCHLPFHINNIAHPI